MIYFGVFGMSAYFAYLASRAKKKDFMLLCTIMCILIPCILAGLRTPSVGKDTGGYGLGHYIAAYRAQSFHDFLKADPRLKRELGWASIVYFPAKIFGNFNINLFIYQLIIMTCTYIALYRHRKIVSLPFVWLIFLLVIYCMTLNYIRQSLAASIIFMGLSTLEQKKYGKFLAYIIAATLFHSSAVIVIIYFTGFHFMSTLKTLHSRMKKLVLYGALGLLACIRPIMNAVITSIPFLITYTGYEQARAGFMFEGFAVAGLLAGELFICTLYPVGMKRVFAYGDMYKFYTYSLIFHLIYRFFVRIFAFRVLYYFDFINVLLLAALPFFIKEKVLRHFMAVAVVLASLVYLYFTSIYHHPGTSVTGTGAWPYRSILM